MGKLVSICIPAYNGEKYIREAVCSALCQTYGEIEVVVINDRSTDGTVETIGDIVNPRLRIVENKENLGLRGNFNRCIQEAKGEYINILCQDDRLASDCIEKKAKMLDDSENVVFVSSDTNIIGGQNDKPMLRKNLKRTGIYDSMEIFKKSIRTRNLYGEPTNVLFRKNIAERTEGFADGLPYTLDWAFWIRLSMYGDIGYISEPLAEFRVSSGSASAALLKDKKSLRDDLDNFFKYVSGFAPVRKSDIMMNRMYQGIRNFEKKVYFAMKSK